MYQQGDGFALETQPFSDLPNQPEFRSTTVYAFSTDKPYRCTAPLSPPPSIAVDWAACQALA
jgi:hypothetical protein